MSQIIEDEEFTIVKNFKRAKLENPNIKPHSEEEVEELGLLPAWVDDDEGDDRQREPILTQSSVLDIHSRLSRKRRAQADKKWSDENDNVEKLYEIIAPNDQTFSGADTPMHRLSDSNMERLARGRLTSVEFNKRYRIFMSTSEDTSLALFNFGKTDCTLLIDRVFQNFPITSAKFTNSGEKIILTGQKRFFKVYDLNRSIESHPKVALELGSSGGLKAVQISPKDDTAAFLATDGVYLVDLRSFQKTATARLSGAAVSHCYSRDGDHLNAFSSDGSVFVFDLRQSARPIHRWSDFGSTTGCSLAISDDSQYIACGSESGFVNLYTRESVMTNLTKYPKPLKSVGNLTSAIDQLLFHPNCQMLYMGSSLQPGAARLFDVESQRVHAGFPACMGRLNVPTTAGFSPRGGFLAVGQTNGHAALYAFDWAGSKY